MHFQPQANKRKSKKECRGVLALVSLHSFRLWTIWWSRIVLPNALAKFQKKVWSCLFLAAQEQLGLFKSAHTERDLRENSKVQVSNDDDA
jgi:hypothetical protein